ncbi:hypothetical protein BC828DRAFT_407926 [Blastocladiella britannica]|nr:hypothetical protein BC828DRAFT_407926 [Blastocladiella britannica]
MSRLFLLTLLSTLAVLTAASTPTDPTADKTVALKTTIDDTFVQQSFYPGQTITYTVDQSSSANGKGVFVTLNYYCWYAGTKAARQIAVSVGGKAAPWSVVDDCDVKDASKANGNKGSAVFYVPPSASGISVKVSSGQPANYYIRANRGVCREPSSDTDRKWAITKANETPLPIGSIPIAFVQGSADSKNAGAATCGSTQNSDGKLYKLADIHTDNNMYAGELARACSAAMGSADNQVVVNSWNGDQYLGSSLSLYFNPAITVSVLTGSGHASLCQPGTGSPTIPVSSNPTGLRVVESVPYTGLAGSNVCGPNQKIAVLSATRLNEYQLAGVLLYNKYGALAKAWIGGWETPTGAEAGSGPQMMFYAPTVQPTTGFQVPGAVAQSAPADLAGGAFPVLCQNKSV